MLGWVDPSGGGKSLAMWPKDVPASRKRRLGNVWDSTDAKYSYRVRLWA